jgi:outer membrane protein assembly factor BamB
MRIYLILIFFSILACNTKNDEELVLPKEYTIFYLTQPFLHENKDYFCFLLMEEFDFADSASNFNITHFTDSARNFHIKLFSKAEPHIELWGKSFTTGVSGYVWLVKISKDKVYIKMDGNLQILNLNDGDTIFNKPCDSFFYAYDSAVVTDHNDTLTSFNLEDFQPIWIKEHSNFWLLQHSGAVKYSLLVKEESSSFIISAVEPNSGNLVWESTIKDLIFISPYHQIIDDFLILESKEYTYCLNLNTGKTIWKFYKKKYNDYSSSNYIRINDNLIFNTYLQTEGKYILVAIDINTGKILWESKQNVYEKQSPIAHNGFVYIFNQKGDKILKLDPENGRVLDKAFITSDDIETPIYLLNNYVYYVKKAGGVYRKKMNLN